MVLAPVPDPVIAAHEAAPALFLLSGPGPISMRDQFIRTRLLIDRLRAAGRLVLPDNRRKGFFSVLVVGGGGSGVSAAILAARAGANTLLVEREPDLFMVQYRTKSRKACATQYNWPLDDYGVAVLPAPGEEWMPLTMSATGGDPEPTGRNIALRWRKEYMDLCKPGLPLSVRNAEVTEIKPDNGALRAVFANGFDATADLVIWAAGFGVENTTVGNLAGLASQRYTGKRFWEDDDFEQVGSGETVLIAGSGDGGLQDLLRVVTGMGLARQILVAFQVPDSCRLELANAEERLWRARMWNNGAGLRSYLAEVEKRCRVMVDVALADPDCEDAMRVFFTGRKSPHVVLVYREAVLTAAYALNRFLVLLIKEFLDRQLEDLGRVDLCPERSLKGATAASPHQVHVEPQLPGNVPAQYDRVIPRFGPPGSYPTLVVIAPAGGPPQRLTVAPPFAWHTLPAHLPQ